MENLLKEFKEHLIEIREELGKLDKEDIELCYEGCFADKISLLVEAQVNQATCGFCKDCKFWNDENVECTKDIVWVLSQNSYLKINDLKTQHYFGCTQFESKLSG